MEVPFKSNLALKLCKIMAEVPDIPKTGRNNFQNYDYVEESKVASTLRPLLAKHNVFIFTSVENCTSEKIETTKGSTYKTHMYLKYTFVDGDSGERQDVFWSAEANDTGDKGIWKCYTGAHKYLLLKTFNLGSDQDPELEETTEKTKIPRGPARGTSTPPVQKGSPPKNLKSDGVEVPLFDEPGEVMTDKGMKVKEVWAKHPVKATQKAKEIFDRIAINDHLQSWEQALIDYGVEKGLLTDA